MNDLTELRPLFAAPLKDFALPRDNAIADRYLNLAYTEVFESHRWANRKKTGSLVLVPNITGTCTVTQFTGANESAAKSVTVSFTPTNEILGRYFKAEGSSYWHKIVAYLGSVLYLESPVVDVGGSLSFEIWKRFYYLKSDADVIYDFEGVIDTDGFVNEGEENATPFGVDPYDEVQYSTGTVSLPKDSNVVTGSGTAFLSAGFSTGDILEVEGKQFFIKRIDSDIKIILFNSLDAEKGIEGAAYSLKKDSSYGFQFRHIATEYKILPYTYLSKAYPLIHPSLDKIQLGRRFIPAIVSRAIYNRFRDSSDARMTTMLQIYDAELNGLKAKVEILSPKYTIFGPKIPSYMPGRG